MHYEGIQNYIDGLGTARTTTHHNSAGLITIPPTQGTREWLVTGLAPNTRYTLNLTGTLTNSEQSSTKIYSLPATIQFSTDYDVPPYVDRPDLDRRAVSGGNHQQVYLRLHRASTKNGPIDRYYVVVYVNDSTTPSTFTPQEVKDQKRNRCLTSNDFLFENSRDDENVATLLRYSMNLNYRKCLSWAMESKLETGNHS